MLPAGELSRALGAVKTSTFSGLLCRFVGLHHCVERKAGGTLAIKKPCVPLSGIGAKWNGARYTPKGSFQTLYLAEDPITALYETKAVQRHPAGDFAATKIWPMAYIAASVSVTLLDVTESEDGGRAISVLGTSIQELTGDWETYNARDQESPTQQLGRACFDSGRFRGIRYLSSKNPGSNGHCVAIFPERLLPDEFIEVFDPFGNLLQRMPSTGDPS